MYGYFCERDYSGDFPYTDLALERRRANTTIGGVDYKKEVSIGGVWERIKITSDAGAKSIGRPIGIYDTLETSRMDLLDSESIEDAKDEIARELCYLMDVLDVCPERILAVGLGNQSLTPDSVGSECADKIKATMHIKEFDESFFYTLDCSEIAVIKPGVAAKSGMDSSVIVRGVCDRIKPSAVIVIDALASRAVERLGTTVQISTTGLIPGSGLGNTRHALNSQTLGAPVVGIGVPTVIDSRMFWMDARADATEAGNTRVLRPSMFVSPKEINEIVSVAAEIIGGGINQAFGIY